MQPDWEKTLSANFGQTDTICNIKQNRGTVETEEETDRRKPKQLFREKFLKLKPGGILICDFQRASFSEVTSCQLIERI